MMDTLTTAYADMINKICFRMFGKAAKKAIIDVVREASSDNVPLGDLYKAAQGAFESVGLEFEDLSGL